MGRIYLDNSATSFPKADGVAKAMYDFLTDDCTSLNRGEYEKEFENENKIIRLRENLASLFSKQDSDCVFFSLNATDAINTFINGYFDNEDEVLITAFEHNAVVRPLVLHGIKYKLISCNANFDLLLEDALVSKNTKAIIASGGSNMFGNAIDIHKISQFAKKHNLPLFIDASQSCPYVDTPLLLCDGVFFTGHKGLLGPQGTGGMVLKRDIANKLRPKNAGGTGSFSTSLKQPDIFPDKFEAGTQNVVGLIGLAKAVEYVLANKDMIYQKALANTLYLIENLKDIKGIEIVNKAPKLPLLSITSNDIDVATLNNYIYEKYQIEARVGVLCAPLALNLINSEGVLRLSPSHKTEKKELDSAIMAIKEGAYELLQHS